MRVGVLALSMLVACSSEDAAKSSLGPTDANTPDARDAHAPDAGDGASVFDGPLNLSETGLYSDILTRSLATGVEPYEVRYPLWSDGSTKQRWLLLPSGETIDTSDIDVWTFPVGTKVWKEFRVGDKLIETRLQQKLTDTAGADSWRMVAYVWNEAGTDAIAAPDGMVDAGGTTHDVPSIEQCGQCHGGAGDSLIGVSAIQLSKENGGGFLSSLAAEGRLSNPPGSEFPVPGDGVVEETLGYLHGNCGHCHNDQSFLASKLALRLKLVTSAANPEETPAYQTSINAVAKHAELGGTTVIVVPGKPSESQLFHRIGVRDLDQMPPLGTEVVDTLAVQFIGSWISYLPP